MCKEETKEYVKDLKQLKSNIKKNLRHDLRKLHRECANDDSKRFGTLGQIFFFITFGHSKMCRL